jgi:(1->4)-alpha-D-glucan 1-alpha-D-glucosylmutase
MRIPSATYRVQFNLNFRFVDAENLVPYLHELGISHLYSSPPAQARRGSLHGYDVADPMRINSEIGTEEEFSRLVARLKKYGMGLLLDIVPNHMAASSENAWWMDVLENGRASAYADFFDIDWESVAAKSPDVQKNRVVLPALGDVYERVLANQEIILRLDDKGFFVQVYETRFPVNAATYADILELCVEIAEKAGTAQAGAAQAGAGAVVAAGASAGGSTTAGGGDSTPVGAVASASASTNVQAGANATVSTGAVDALEALIHAAKEVGRVQELASAGTAGAATGGKPADSQLTAKIKHLKTELWKRYLDDPTLKKSLDETLHVFNGVKGDAASLDRLDTLLSQQNYRLGFWRTANAEVNYRRFFALNELVGLRVEDPSVFETTHAKVFSLVKRDHIDGLRVDHIDGLRDPLEYLERLQTVRKAAPAEDSDALNVYTVVEKIRSGTESLPKEWPTAGTTGYDFMNAVNTLFIDAQGSKDLETSYRDFTGIRSSFTDTWYVRKKQVMEELFEAEFRLLANRLARVAAFDRLGRDVPMAQLVRGLKEITARLAIYRTYSRDLELSSRDRLFLGNALMYARERTQPEAVSADAFDFLQRVFLRDPVPTSPDHQEALLDFILRWQQVSGAVMAKGFEDTAFFVHHGLVSLNEVGADPFRKQIRFGVSGFHQYNRRAFSEYPHTLNCTATHDSKWGEDVRARINVLSEIPEEWQKRFKHWAEINQPLKATIEGRVVPSPNEEVLLYQSLLGVWPLEEPNLGDLQARMEAFILKAAREAKTHSSWTSPNESHEAALKSFLAGLLAPGPENFFLADFTAFLNELAAYGACNGYAQILMKMISPGIPDFFQGTELWQFALTDPDNRRPVDYQKITKLFSQLNAGGLNGEEPNAQQSNSQLLRDMLMNWKDGLLKLYLIKQTLNYRAAQRELFMRGDYVALETSADKRENVCAFARSRQNVWAITAVPRLASKLAKPGGFPTGRDSWGEGKLMLPARAPSTWKNLFTGETLEVPKGARALQLADVFASLPFAILVHEPVQ